MTTRAEEERMVEESLAERWAHLLGEGDTLQVDSERRDDGSFRARFRLETADGTAVELEALADLATGREDEALRLFVYDALDAVLGEWLESDRDERLIGVWEQREFENRPLLVRRLKKNARLEREADELLRR